MKKVLSAIAFVAIAMISGSIVSIYRMDKSLVEARDAAQVEIADTVQADEMPFFCGISGCTLTEVHRHGLCGIDGCTQMGEHHHGGNGEGHHRSGHGGGHH